VPPGDESGSDPLSGDGLGIGASIREAPRDVMPNEAAPEDQRTFVAGEDLQLRVPFAPNRRPGNRIQLRAERGGERLGAAIGAPQKTIPLPDRLEEPGEQTIFLRDPVSGETEALTFEVEDPSELSGREQAVNRRGRQNLRDRAAGEADDPDTFAGEKGGERAQAARELEQAAGKQLNSPAERAAAAERLATRARRVRRRAGISADELAPGAGPSTVVGPRNPVNPTAEAARVERRARISDGAERTTGRNVRGELTDQVPQFDPTTTTGRAVQVSDTDESPGVRRQVGSVTAAGVGVPNVGGRAGAGLLGGRSPFAPDRAPTVRNDFFAKSDAIPTEREVTADVRAFVGLNPTEPLRGLRRRGIPSDRDVDRAIGNVTADVTGQRPPTESEVVADAVTTIDERTGGGATTAREARLRARRRLLTAGDDVATGVATGTALPVALAEPTPAGELALAAGVTAGAATATATPGEEVPNPLTDQSELAVPDKAPEDSGEVAVPDSGRVRVRELAVPDEAPDGGGELPRPERPRTQRSELAVPEQTDRTPLDVLRTSGPVELTREEVEELTEEDGDKLFEPRRREGLDIDELDEQVAVDLPTGADDPVVLGEQEQPPVEREVVERPAVQKEVTTPDGGDAVGELDSEPELPQQQTAQAVRGATDPALQTNPLAGVFTDSTAQPAVNTTPDTGTRLRADTATVQVPQVDQRVRTRTRPLQERLATETTPVPDTVTPPETETVNPPRFATPPATAAPPSNTPTRTRLPEIESPDEDRRDEPRFAFGFAFESGVASPDTVLEGGTTAVNTPSGGIEIGEVEPLEEYE